MDADDDPAALFKSAVGLVTPVKNDRVIPDKLPRPRRNHRAAPDRMADLLRDDAPDTPEDWVVGEFLSYRRPGVQDSVLRKLKRGTYRVDAELDLHGYTALEARTETKRFLLLAQSQSQRCLRIIHGRSIARAGGPVLKTMLDYWLRGRREVLAFATAPINQGGGGALLALLSKKTNEH